MKIKIIHLSLILFCLIFATDSFSQEMVKGTIIATPQNVISVGTGEKVITNLGKKDGVIPGDILKIVESDDNILIGHIGKCAVISAEDSTSVCKVIKLSAEAGKGDYVFINKLEYTDPRMYPLVFTLLNEVIALYEPQRVIRVYVHNIYDEKNNITRFSERIKEEIVTVFEQKQRMAVNRTVLKDYVNYQDHYFNSATGKSNKKAIDRLKNSMEQLNIDVVITGVYAVQGDSIQLKLYIVDRRRQDKAMSLIMGAKDYLNAIAQTVIPYELFKEKEFVNYSIILNMKDYLPDKDEQREIVKHESEKELKFRYKFADTKSKFNRISPGEVYLKINEEEIKDMPGGVVYEKNFVKGMKRISVSFVPTLCDNDNEVFQLKKEIKKEIILDLKDEDKISIEIMLDATYEKEKIDIKVVRKTTKEPIIMKSVISKVDKKPAIELYKD
ncbi:MAG: hypothetical protein C0392_00490 [Syntrophus sp. (in: bacteria)]|nr:hypothetical protein [Syntrophus sp. (in: bacteria)]